MEETATPSGIAAAEEEGEVVGEYDRLPWHHGEQGFSVEVLEGGVGSSQATDSIFGGEGVSNVYASDERLNALRLRRHFVRTMINRNDHVHEDIIEAWRDELEILNERYENMKIILEGKDGEGS